MASAVTHNSASPLYHSLCYNKIHAIARLLRFLWYDGFRPETGDERHETGAWSLSLVSRLLSHVSKRAKEQIMRSSRLFRSKHVRSRTTWSALAIALLL